jgi:hypothetical protein
MSFTPAQERLLNMFHWSITEPLQNAESMLYDEHRDTDIIVPALDEVFDIPLNIEQGDRVVLAYYDNIPSIIVPVEGTTIRDFFQCIENGMKSIFQPTDAPIVYKHIGEKTDKIVREHFIQKFENGELTKKEIYGNDTSVLFESNIKREQNGIWMFDLYVCK